MEKNKFEGAEKTLEDNNKKTKKKLPVVNVKLAILGVIVLLCGFLTYFLLTGTLFTPKTPSIAKQANIDKTNPFGDINTPSNQNINQNTINTAQPTNIIGQQNQQYNQQQNQQQNQQNVPINQAQTQTNTEQKTASTTTPTQSDVAKTNKNIAEKDNDKIKQPKKIKKVISKFKKEKEQQKEEIFYLPVDEIRADSFVLGGNEYIKGDMLNLHING